MKRTYIFVILAVLCAIGLSAKTIYIWRNGVKTDLPIQTNDSITFDETNAPTMHFWRAGSEIYQMTLAVNDSITYSPESAVTPDDPSSFTYENWRTKTKINIYGFPDPVALPWNGAATTALPTEYKAPNKDSLPDGTPKWQLAFNLCDSSSLPGVNVFGLWDAHSQIMRVYTYIQQMPNSSEKYCYYAITSSEDAFIDAESKAWQPADSTIRTCGWGATISDDFPLPSKRNCQVIPITSSVNNGSVNPGWICTELHFDAGIFSVPKDATITFSLFAIEELDFTAAMTLEGKLTGQDCKLIIPASKNKKASAWLKAIGSLFTNVASVVSATEKSSDGTVGTSIAVIGGIGAATSFVGDAFNAKQTGNKQEYTLQLNFNISATADITGSLTSLHGTSIPSPQLNYSNFFEQILLHSNSGQNNIQSRGRNNSPKSSEDIQLGLWNLKRQPVYYVAKDAVDENIAFADSVRVNFISFLDPTSIELELNTDNILFSHEDIDSVNLLAYDFVFTDSSYNMPSKPYYKYYNIPQDSVSYVYSWLEGSYGTMGIGNVASKYRHINDRAYLLNPDAEYVSDTVRSGIIKHKYHVDSYKYIATGVEAKLDSLGLGEYNLMYSPAMGVYIHSSIGERDTINFPKDIIGVAVVLEVVFKNGDRRIFADRFLPEIKAFSKDEASVIRDKIKNSPAPSSVGSIPLNNPLYDSQRNKAVRLLDPLVNELAETYPLVPITNQLNGIRIRKYKNEQMKGIVIVTSESELPSPTTELETLEGLQCLLWSLDDWENIDARLNQLDMPSLRNNPYYEPNNLCRNFTETPQTHVNCEGNTCYIKVYLEDEDGTLTPHPDLLSLCD